MRIVREEAGHINGEIIKVGEEIEEVEGVGLEDGVADVHHNGRWKLVVR